LISNSVRTFFADHQGNWWIGNWEGLNYYARQHGHIQIARTVLGRSGGLLDDNIYVLAEGEKGALWIGSHQAGVHRLDPTRRVVSVFKNESDSAGSLSGNNVHSLLVDRQGVLWVGLFEAGLCRKGTTSERFTCYQNNPEDSTSSSDNNVYALLEDRQGRLWIGTNRAGLNRFDADRGEFIRYEANRRPGSLVGSSITSLLEDQRGFLWVGTTRGLSRYRPEHDDFVTYTDDQRPNEGLRGISSACTRRRTVPCG
jgi:ligand-binding sensor domain-containing protein